MATVTIIEIFQVAGSIYSQIEQAQANKKQFELLGQGIGYGYNNRNSYLDGDRDGWRSFAISARARVWMGADFDPNQLVMHLQRDIGALVQTDGDPPIPIGLQTLEGFVFGWSAMCLALDMDPGLVWANIITSRLLDSQPTELDIYTPVLPRFQLVLEKITIDKIREEGEGVRYPGEEPYLWIIPAIMEFSAESGAASYCIINSADENFYLYGSLKAGDIVTPNKVFKWQVSCPQPRATIYY